MQFFTSSLNWCFLESFGECLDLCPLNYNFKTHDDSWGSPKNFLYLQLYGVNLHDFPTLRLIPLWRICVSLLKCLYLENSSCFAYWFSGLSAPTVSLLAIMLMNSCLHLLLLWDLTHQNLFSTALLLEQSATSMKDTILLLAFTFLDYFYQKRPYCIL